VAASVKVLTADTGLGELVYIGIAVDDHAEDDECDCWRTFMGLTTKAATTTAVVAELDTTRRQIRAIFADQLPGPAAQPFADDMLREARRWPTGTRLRRHIHEVVAE
jgi:hypothetical protein